MKKMLTFAAVLVLMFGFFGEGTLSEVIQTESMPSVQTEGVEEMDISKIILGNDEYDLQDSVARSATNSLDEAVFDTDTEEELVPITLSFNSYGWWSSSRYYDTQDGKKAEVSVSAGEKYDIKAMSIWSYAPYVVLDASNNILASGAESGSGTYTTTEATITIPSGGVKLVFSAQATNTTWQNYDECKKHVTTIIKTSKIETLEDKTDENTGNIADLQDAISVSVSNQENLALNWIDGKGYLSNGNEIVDNGYSYVLLDVAPGDRYEFTYYSQWTVTYVIFDSNMSKISAGSTSDSATWTKYEADVTMPAGASKLALTITSYRPSEQVTNTYVHHYFSETYTLEEYVLGELQKQNILYGKKWFATGDSFTHGSITDPDENPIFQDGPYMGKRKTYPYFIGLRNNMTVINDGLSGSTIAQIKPGDSYETTPFSDTSRYQSIPEDVDYITLWFGINDANHCLLGTIDDETSATFYGAWNVVLDWILTNRPNAKVGIIITNLSTEAFREATREICHKWGIPYLDMMGDYQVPPTIGGRETDLGMCEEAVALRMNHFRISSNNDHPTVNCHRYWSTFIEAFLRGL